MRERSARHLSCWLVRFTVLACLMKPIGASAQPPPTGPLTLNDAIQMAVRNYPAIKERRARAQAAEERVGVAQTAYLPRLDLLWQENRATTNNVFGVLLPQSTIFSMTGPVLGTRSFGDSVWGSAVGALLSWEAVDFGLRKAGVDVARAQSSLAKNEVALTELDVASAAADAFLTVLAADESVRAARANTDRLQVFANSVRTLVQNQLRPGADQSRSEAELAVAKNQLSQAIQTADIARAALADAIGSAGASFELTIGSLSVVPDVPISPADVKSHPAARVGQSGVEVVRARQQTLDREYFPRIILQSTIAARGTGADIPGVPSFGNGLWP